MTGLRKSDKKIKKQKKKYILNAKRFKVVIDELKERISTKSEKLMRYRTRDNQYRLNKLFWCNQKALYRDLGGKERSAQVPPNAEEAKKFWSKLWDNPLPYKEDAKWLKQVELELENFNIQRDLEISKMLQCN